MTSALRSENIDKYPMQHRQKQTNCDYRIAVEDLYDRGAIDPAGGVPSVTVAEELGVAAATAGDHLSRLVDEGVLEVVWGFTPQGPRRGYRPVKDEPL